MGATSSGHMMASVSQPRHGPGLQAGVPQVVEAGVAAAHQPAWLRIEQCGRLQSICCSAMSGKVRSVLPRHQVCCGCVTWCDVQLLLAASVQLQRRA
jgi:hypothetical protein